MDSLKLTTNRRSKPSFVNHIPSVTRDCASLSSSKGPPAIKLSYATCYDKERNGSIDPGLFSDSKSL